jgi:hypothetical protein
MSHLIPNRERIDRTQSLIQKARDLPVQPELGWKDLLYGAQAKNLLRQVCDLIKFILYFYFPSITSEIRTNVTKFFNEIDQDYKEILYK